MAHNAQASFDVATLVSEVAAALQAGVGRADVRPRGPAPPDPIGHLRPLYRLSHLGRVQKVDEDPVALLAWTNRLRAVAACATARLIANRKRPAIDATVDRVFARVPHHHPVYRRRGLSACTYRVG